MLGIKSVIAAWAQVVVASGAGALVASRRRAFMQPKPSASNWLSEETKMRGFIRFCGGLFVVAGMLGFALSALAALVSTAGGWFFAPAVLVMVFGSAGAALIGGTAFMLCEIDSRLERIADATPRAVPSILSPASAAP